MISWFLGAGEGIQFHELSHVIEAKTIIFEFLKIKFIQWWYKRVTPASDTQHLQPKTVIVTICDWLEHNKHCQNCVHDFDM